MSEAQAVDSKTCPHCKRTYGRISPSGRRIAGKEWTERTACSRKCAWQIRKANGYNSAEHHWRKYTPADEAAMIAEYNALPRGPKGRCCNNVREKLEAKWGCSRGYTSELARKRASSGNA